MNNKIRVLIQGTGFAGQGHAEAFRSVGAEVVGIVGRTPSVVQQVAQELAIPYAGSDWQQALIDCKPDLVSIATPGGAHKEAIQQAIEFGCLCLCIIRGLGRSGLRLCANPSSGSYFNSLCHSGSRYGRRAYRVGE